MSAQPIKWHGGKSYLAKKIVALMPPRCKNPNAPAPDDPGYLHYCEPYFGGGAVLLENDPEGISEVVNDLNGELTAFWRTLQNDRMFEIFCREIEATPFSEVEYRAATVAGKDFAEFIESEPVACAVNFFIRCRQSLAGRMGDFAPLSKTRTRRGMNEQVSAWLGAIEGLPAVHARLKRVLILNREALDVIKEQDGERTLFYCLHPDTRVRAKNEDMIPIRDVEEGTVLFGGRTVKRVLCRRHDGELLSVRIQGVPEPMLTTPDHPWLVVPRCEGRQERRTDGQLCAQRRVVVAEDLHVGDLVPVSTGGYEELPMWHLDDEPTGPRARLKEVELRVGPSLFRFLGYYAADGHVQRDAAGVPRSVVLSFGTAKKHRQIADAAVCGLAAFQVEPTTHSGRPHPTVTQVTLHSTPAAKFVASVVVGTATIKTLASAIMVAPTEWQKELLSAWVRTDGHEGDEGRGRVKLCGTSASRVLAEQMYALALRCGLRPSFKSRRNSPSSVSYDVYFASEDARSLGMAVPDRASRSTRRIVDGLIYSRIRSIIAVPYSGLVYDLDVDGDNLFCAPFVLTHNCDPPYLHETREATDVYAHEMSWEDHNRLLAMLSKLKGRFMLSGYRSNMYDGAAKMYGWKRHDFEISNHASGAKEKRRMVECLWVNF